ncbi:tripartite tricarboxylate transporter TctB family protein [Rhizobium glycinendophyticum]|uniref:Tripartite tricarboxylate transporter TctB family protein n=1 Tax=Rhizobium glycinendophyticum TaxID=2589807 RepID=A0A504TWZ0_9HYPH|nr:tripartite tricarboxylate transporter TctB family protein [Rhizobium glycinendophyticum]TPP06689.1 tripartite tricarboxylate transporter TctB family protein [Rhizobium glycinendophyticum]
MSENTRTHQLIGRISALVLLLLAAAYGIGGSMIEYAFSSDPLGPRVVPVMLSVLLGLLALLYLKFPGSAEGFPTGQSLVRVLAVPVALIVSVALMEPLGFAAAIFLLTTVTGWIFGAPLKLSLIGGVVHAALWWFIFSFLLEVYLPTGAIFG